MEKLVDIVTFIHQEIPEVFGANGMEVIYIFALIFLSLLSLYQQSGMMNFIGIKMSVACKLQRPSPTLHHVALYPYLLILRWWFFMFPLGK